MYIFLFYFLCLKYVFKIQKQMSWLADEEIYLHTIQKSCETLSNEYLKKHRKWKKLQARIKIPVIIIGSFTGITSFGTETFPQYAQKWISVGVGVITVGIAILNTIESYFKIGENANSAINASNALQKLREDINKELSIPEEDRQAPGVTFLRDCFTRYQQILSQAPTLDEGNVFYIDAIVNNKISVMIKRNNKKIRKEEEEIDKLSMIEGGRTLRSMDIGTPSSKKFFDKFKGMMTKSNQYSETLETVPEYNVPEPFMLNNGLLNTEILKQKLSTIVDSKSDIEAPPSLYNAPNSTLYDIKSVQGTELRERTSSKSIPFIQDNNFVIPEIVIVNDTDQKQEQVKKDL